MQMESANKKSLSLFCMLILFTTVMAWGWHSYVLSITTDYLTQHSDFEVHKFMPTLQVLLVSAFFIVHFVLALIYFRNRFWYWGLWLAIAPIMVGQAYFSVFGIAAHIDAFSVWVDWPFILLMLVQICMVFIVYALYLQPATLSD